MKKNLDLITVESINVSNVIDILDQYGCCVINNYINNEELSKLRLEFDKVFVNAKSDSSCVVHNHPTNNNACMQFVRQIN